MFLPIIELPIDTKCTKTLAYQLLIAASHADTIIITCDSLFVSPQYHTITVGFVKWQIAQQVFPCFRSDFRTNALQTMYKQTITLSSSVDV